MAESSIIDKCVKCGCKFTSPEKPLKLLPCLHSMCLDCLHGRIPVPPKPKSSPDDESGSKKIVSSEINQDEQVAVADKVESGTTEDGDSKTASTSNETVAAEVNGDVESDSSKITASASHDDNDVSIDKSGTGTLESDEKGAPQSPTDTGDSNTETDKKTNGVETKEDETVIQGGEDKVEAQDIKPKPATECPICRDPIEQQGAILMDNMFATLDPGKPSSPTEDVSHMCTACEEGQEAPFYCMQCEEWLCDSCVDAHKRVRITKDHTIVPKDEVDVSTSKSPWEQQMICKQHRQEELKFFCEPCEKLTCRDCQLMDHKDHKYQFLDQAAEQYKQRLRGSLALMGEKRTKLASSRDEIEQKLKNCKEQKETLQQDILKQTDVLVKGIRTAVWGVLSNLASFTDAATKRLNKEIDDVSDLVGKFDHCIQFMEDILKEGSSMSLLYSKGNVETKCRKVYHTQVDPQSLKGTLTIQYKHDVNWLLGNLGKIGAIFVNGVRYPPDKNGRSGGSSGSNSNQGPQGYQESRPGGIGTTSQHLQHMANQPIPGQRVPPELTKYIQSMSKPGHPQAPPNMTMSGMSAGGAGGALPPQLTLPSNRRGGASVVTPPQWQQQGPASVPGSPFAGHFVAGQLLTPQQQQASARPTFTPMRLYHRPATQSSFPNSNDHGPASNNMRSPPLYNRQGSEASGSSRQGHGTPDPARPASAGMYDASGPSRADGSGPAMVDIKKERRDHSPDCVIMSSSMKSSDRSTGFHGNLKHSDTAMEMQRNLDEVLRAVPMDLSDNMEQISGTKPKSTVQGEHGKSSNTVSETAPQPAQPPSLVPAPAMTSAPEKGGDNPESASITNVHSVEATPPSPTDQELRENWQGGNSMPGFSLAQSDPNDDYCACCHNGGDVLCCDKCPKVFHLQCHIPEMAAVPTGSFVCTICEGDDPVQLEENNGKRTIPGGLTESEIKACERILLELYCHPSSVPFQEPVNRLQIPNYYKIITQPMDFTQVKCKLQRSHSSHYQSVKAYLWDMRQIFINCAIYNKTGSEVGKAGKMVREQFEALVGRLFPQYLSFVQESPTPCFSAVFNADSCPVSADNSTTNDTTQGPSSPKRPRIE